MYEWAHDTGLKHGSCMNYEAKNLDSCTCADIDICRDCAWGATGPPPPGESGIENCFAVEDTNYYVSEYYSVKGAD